MKESSEVKSRKSPANKLDLSGHRYNNVIVISEALQNKENRRWYCRYDCGHLFIAYQGSLRDGNTKSCGCLQKKIVSDKFKTHGYSAHKLYGVWKAMKSRCYRESDRNFDNYGFRGISVCDEWRYSAKIFIDWCINNGWAEGIEIDRINNDGNYCPDNLRFVTRQENCSNTRRNIFIEVNGRLMTVTDASRCAGISHRAILSRIHRGTSPQEAYEAIINRV